MITKKLKLPFTHYKLLKKKIFIKNKKQTHTLKTHSRTSAILPCMLNLTIAIHNGHKYIPLTVSESNIGYKLGEFSFTKTFFSHTKTEKKINYVKK